MKSLQDLCICRIATEFYFDRDEEGIEKLKLKFGIVDEITPEIEDNLKREFPWAFSEGDSFLPQNVVKNNSEEKRPGEN